jgi:hypothetical protein
VVRVELTAERVARNESVFRLANESIAATARHLGAELERIPFICECPRPGCTTVVPLSLDEYEHVRAEGAWFLVALGHEVYDVDGVAIARKQEQHATFSLMEKIGTAGVVSEELDPRQD